jgi:hypothetical protein
MALGTTQPLTDTSTRVSPGEYRRPVRRPDKLPNFMSRFSRNSPDLKLLEPPRASQDLKWEGLLGLVIVSQALLRGNFGNRLRKY